MRCPLSNVGVTRGGAGLLILALSGGATEGWASPPLAPTWLEATAWSMPPNLAVVEVEVRGHDQPPPGAVVSAVWQRPKIPGRHAVRLRVEQAGKTQELWAMVEVLRVAEVWSVARDLPGGHVLQASDLVLDRRPVPRGRRRPLVAGSRPVGRRLLHAREAGQLLDQGDLEALSPWPRGAQVEIRVTTGGLQVSTVGILQRSLRPGESGPVRLERSHRLVTATMQEDGTALLEDRP